MCGIIATIAYLTTAQTHRLTNVMNVVSLANLNVPVKVLFARNVAITTAQKCLSLAAYVAIWVALMPAHLMPENKKK